MRLLGCGRGVTFDGMVGVSAGACFGCNSKSGQIGRKAGEAAKVTLDEAH